MKLQITEHTPVADVVVQYPQTRKLLESHGIDYCCGGKQSFKAACDKANVSWQDMRNQLKETIKQTAGTPPPKEWVTASLSELVQHIIDAHHAYLREHLPRLDNLVEKVYRAHRERHGEMIQTLRLSLETLRAEIEMHLDKEEQILFPLMKDMEAFAEGHGSKPTIHCGTIENPIRQMSFEHDSAGELLAQMRQLTSGYEPPEDACESFKALYDGLRELENDLHDHIHLENNILFPKAIQLENKICAAL